MAVLVNGERPRLIDPSTGRPFDGYDGGFSVPPVLTHASILNQALKVYSAIRRDDAMKFGRKDALAMEADTFLQSLMLERYEATALLKWHVEPEDPKDPAQKAEADYMQKVIERTPNFQHYRMSCLWAIWFGRSGVQHVISQNDRWGRPVIVNGRRSWAIAKHSPVRGDKIEFSYQFDEDEPDCPKMEEGTPLILINASHADNLRRKGATVHRSDLYTSLVLTPGYWRERFVIHKHLTKDYDPFDQPEKQGQIHGYGVRDQIFWYDWVRKEWLSNVSDFIDQIGKGCQIYPYDASNPANEQKAIDAAKAQSRNTVIVWPIWPDRPGQVLPTTMNTPMDGSRVLLELMQHMEGHIERYIIGQTGSSRSDTSGMGTHDTGFMEDCVPVEGSEILTRRGFKKADEVVVGEEVLAYDCEGDVCRWTPLLDKTFYSDRAVSKLSTGTKKGFEAICTPKHSWATEKQGCLSRRLVEARNLGPKDSIILAAPELEDKESLLTPTEAAILGWSVTDGHIRKAGRGYRVGICQSKRKYIKEIRELVEPLGAYEWKGKPFSRTFPTGNTSDCLPQHWWYLLRTASNNLLDKCGYRTKADLPGIVTRLSYGSRSAMLDAFLKAEGDSKGVFANKDPHVMEAFDILCALQGVATGKLLHKKTCDAKTVKKSGVVYASCLKLEDAGRCDIWCPSTRYGTWVMRQNGRVTITGNTKYRRIRWDCQNLDETLTDQLLGPLHRWNCPDSQTRLFFRSDIDKPNAAEMLQAGQSLYQMNVEVKKDELRAYAGFTKPEKGDEIASQMSDQQGMAQIQQEAEGGGEDETQAVQAKAQAEQLKAQSEAQKHRQQIEQQKEKHKLEIEKMALELMQLEKKHKLEMQQLVHKGRMQRDMAEQDVVNRERQVRSQERLAREKAIIGAATRMRQAQGRPVRPVRQTTGPNGPVVRRR